MIILDITRPLTPGMAVYPGDPPVELMPIIHADVDGVAVSALHLGTHTGTHVDPPAHLLPGGTTVDQLSLATLVGAAQVVRLPGEDAAVQPGELATSVPAGCTRLLLRTRQAGAGRPAGIDSDGRGLSPAAAEWIVAAGIQLVGIDSLSIDDADAPQLPAHRILLTAGVVIVECLDLAAVEPGEYTLICLPLRLAGADGAPARAVLTR